MASGEQCVTLYGLAIILEWYADNLDSLHPLVRSTFEALIVPILLQTSIVTLSFSLHCYLPLPVLIMQPVHCCPLFSLLMNLA